MTGGWNRARIVRWASRAGLAVLVLFASSAVAAKWEEISGSFERVTWSPDPLALAASVAILAASLALNPSGWMILARELGSDTPVAGLRAAWFASQLGRYMPGKIWLFAGRIGFLRSEGLSTARAVAASVWELIAGAAAAGAVALPCILLSGATGIVPAVRTAAAAAAAAMLLLPLLGPVQKAAFALEGGAAFTGIGTATGLRVAGLFCALWAARGISLHLWLTGLGLETRGFWPVMAAAPLSWLAGYIVFVVPGGIGVRETVIAALVAPSGTAGPVVAACLGQTLLMAVLEILLALPSFRAAPGARGIAKGGTDDAASG